MADVIYDQYTEIKDKIFACNAFIEELKTSLDAYTSKYRQRSNDLKECLSELAPYIYHAEKALRATSLPLPPASETEVPNTAMLNALLYRTAKGNLAAARELYSLTKAREHHLESMLQQEDTLEREYSKKHYDTKFAHLKELQLDLNKFAASVLTQNAPFRDTATHTHIPIPTSNRGNFVIGLQRAYYPLPEWTSAHVGDLYDADSQFVHIPVCLKLPFALRIDYTPEASQDTYQQLSYYLCNIIRNYTPMDGRVFFFNPASYDPTSLLGDLALLCGKQNFIHFPTNNEELSKELDFLNGCDHSEPRFLFLHNYPHAYSNMQLFDSLRLLIANSQRNNICVIMTHLQQNYSHWEPNDAEAMSSANMLVVERTAQGNSYNQNPFLFQSVTRGYSRDILTPFIERNKPKATSIHYLDNHPLPDISKEVSYQRVFQKDRSNLLLPIGVTGDKKEEYSLDLRGENSFGYLMGATGSGKSTLLHLILLGAITKYHPDDLEIWLADFGKATFNRYIHHCPPHVKYIILEAGDMQKPSVYAVDFINQMHKELKRREAFCTKTGQDELKNVDINLVMPGILILIDEFSRLSATISDNDEAKIKLQEVITQDRKFGFRMICDSQSYGTSASRALTQEAKNNMGVRMAMRHTDISDQTDALALNLQGDDQAKLKETLRDLPKYHTICRTWSDNGSQWKLVSNYAINMDKDSADETTIFNWIDLLKEKMTAVSSHEQYPDATEYPEGKTCYLDKGLIAVDGVTTENFSALEAYLQKEPLTCSFNKVSLIAGRPGSFRTVHPIELLPEPATGQNILFFCKNNRLEIRDAVLRSFGQALPLSAPGMAHEHWDGKTVNIDYLKLRIKVLYDYLDRCEPLNRLITISDIPSLIGRLRPRIRPLTANSTIDSTNTSLANAVDIFLQAQDAGASQDEVQAMINEFNSRRNDVQTNETAAKIRYEQLLGYLLHYGAESRLHFICTAPDAVSMNSVHTALSFIPGEYKLKPFAHFMATQMAADDIYSSDLPFKAQFKQLPDDLVLYSDGIRLCYYSPYTFD